MDQDKDAELKFFNIIGNDICAAELLQLKYAKEPSLENKLLIERNKKDAYKHFYKFCKGGFTPKNRITPENINLLEEYKNLDWTKQEVIALIKDYLQSLYPKH